MSDQRLSALVGSNGVKTMVDQLLRADRPTAGEKTPNAKGRFNDELDNVRIKAGLKPAGAGEAVTGLEFIQGKAFKEYRAGNKYGTGAITLEAEDSKSRAVFEPNGQGGRGKCLSVRDRSGAIISPTDGGLSVRQPNGNKQILKGGSIDSNGTITFTGADGLQRQRFLDGSTATLNPDGTSQTVRPDGSRQTRQQVSPNEVRTTEMVGGKKIEERDFSNPEDLRVKPSNSRPEGLLKGVSKATNTYNEFSLIESQKFDFSPEAPRVTVRTSDGGTLSFKPSSLTVKHENWNDVEYKLRKEAGANSLEYKDKEGNVVPLRADSIRVTRDSQGERYQINPGSPGVIIDGKKNEQVNLPSDPPIFARSENNNATPRESKEARQERLDKVKTQVETLVTRYTANTKREQNAETEAERANIKADLLKLGREALPTIERLNEQNLNPETERFLSQITSDIKKSPIPPEAITEMEERSFALVTEKSRAGGSNLTAADKQRIESLIDRLKEPLPGGVQPEDLDRALSIAEREQGNRPPTARQLLLESGLTNKLEAEILYAGSLSDSSNDADQQEAVKRLSSLVSTNFELLADPDFQKMVTARAINEPEFLNAVREEGRRRGVNPLALNDLLDSIKNIKRVRIRNGRAAPQ